MKNNMVKYSGIVALGVVFFTLSAPAVVAPDPVHLSYNGHSASVTLAGPGAGMTDWVAGGADRLNLQWFYFRSQPGVNLPVDSLGLTSYSSTANYLTATYGTSLQITIQYLLGVSGSSPDILESITIRNNTGAAINGFQFFQYSDFDLSTSDNVYISSSMDNLQFDIASQFGGPAELSETIATPAAALAEAGQVPTLLNKITSAPNSNLNGNLTWEGGNAAWAFQWTFDIANGGQKDIVKDKQLSVTPVPEPTVFSLGLLGLAGLIFRRKV